jgi:transposase
MVWLGLRNTKIMASSLRLVPPKHRLRIQDAPTNGADLVAVIKTIPRPRHLVLEEGTHSDWLVEILMPHVDELVVEALMHKTPGNKNDQRDAFAQAEKLRQGAIGSRVFKHTGPWSLLRELARVVRMIVSDSVRVQNRLHALYRSRAIAVQREILKEGSRQRCASQLPAKLQPVAELLSRQYDAIELIRKDAETQMLAEAKRHQPVQLLRTVPGIGPIRAAQIAPIILDPFRFRTRAQLWTYAGLAVNMRSSADWIQAPGGRWRRAPVKGTRGLNRNHNHVLKSLLKDAATTVIGRADSDCPLYRHYASLTGGRTKPDMAKLTIARQIAAIVLAILKAQERYDPGKVSMIPTGDQTKTT